MCPSGHYLSGRSRLMEVTALPEEVPGRRDICLGRPTPMHWTAFLPIFFIGFEEEEVGTISAAKERGLCGGRRTVSCAEIRKIFIPLLISIPFQSNGFFRERATNF